MLHLGCIEGIATATFARLSMHSKGSNAAFSTDTSWQDIENMVAETLEIYSRLKLSNLEIEVFFLSHSLIFNDDDNNDGNDNSLLIFPLYIEGML